MSTPSSGSAGNGSGGERFDVHGDLGSKSEIQQLLTVLFRQMGHLASRLTDNERQPAEEAANDTAMRAAQKSEEERRKGREVQEWNARMSFLQAVRISLERRSTTTAVEQGEATGYVQRSEPSGEPGFRRELTRRELPVRLGQRSNAYRAENPFDGGESDVPVGFGSAEDQNHSDDDPMGESDLGVLKEVKWQIPVFDGKTTSRRRFEMEFLVAICNTYVWTLCSLATRRRYLSRIERFHATA